MKSAMKKAAMKKAMKTRKTCQSSRAEGRQREDQWWTPQKPNHEKQARQGGLENEVGAVAQKVQGQQAGGMDEGSHGSEEGAGHHWLRGIEWQNSARPSFVREGEGELHSLSLPARPRLEVFFKTACSVVLVPVPHACCAVQSWAHTCECMHP